MNDLQHFAAKLAGYMICDVDDANDPKYYGFANQNGHWYILEENTANKTYRYCKGATAYDTNWTNRASLTYDYVYNVFNQ